MEISLGCQLTLVSFLSASQSRAGTILGLFLLCRATQVKVGLIVNWTVSFAGISSKLSLQETAHKEEKTYSKFCIIFLSLSSYFLMESFIIQPSLICKLAIYFFFFSLYHFGRLLWNCSALMSKNLSASSLCLFTVNSYPSVPESFNVKCSGVVLQFVVLSFFPVSAIEII